MSVKTARWAIGVWQGERAKSVKAHADAGIGYLFLNEDGQGQKYTVRAAFRLPDGLPLPENGRYATEQESRKYEERHRKGQGLPT